MFSLQISQMHVTGLPPMTGLNIQPPQPFVGGHPFATPHRLSCGIVTSSRPASAMDARFDDEVCKSVCDPTYLFKFRVSSDSYIPIFSHIFEKFL